MTPYKTPGVYVKEISSFPPAIADVETAIPAFIGFTEKALANGNGDVTLKPTKISSLAAYEEIFGGTPPPNTFYTYYSLKLFFANGGKACYIISIGDYDSNPAAKDQFLAGLKALEKEDEPTLILFPDALLLAKGMYAVQREALRQCNDRRDRFALLDLREPSGIGGSRETINWQKGVEEFRNNIGRQFLKFGAAYTPHLKMHLSEKAGSTCVAVPPSGAIAGVYAKTDQSRGVWKAPANVSLTGVAGLTEIIDPGKQDDLNVDPVGGKSVNAIRSFGGRGILVWGARTLAGNDNEWRYIPVRRFFNMVEESLIKATGWAVFESNDASTWNRVGTMIENYLMLKWRAGALKGATTEDAFFVRIGLGATMTDQDIIAGRMNVEIGLAVIRPAEFIMLKFSHRTAEA